MTLVPMHKRCPRCKKTYSWNPDVGEKFCPRCGFLSIPGTDLPRKKTVLDSLHGRKK